MLRSLPVLESTAKPAMELWPRLEAYTNLPSFEISISAQEFLLPSNPAGNVLAVWKSLRWPVARSNAYAVTLSPYSLSQYTMRSFG